MMFLLHKIIIFFFLGVYLCDGKPVGNVGRLFRRRLGLPPPPEVTDRMVNGVETKYFTQPLDHFDQTVNVTWQQRYQVQDAYFKTGGPIFVFIGGEGPISASWLSTGNMVVNAKKHGALLFQPEHRYYGQSHPTNDTSKANLKYLSSRQALADLDDFIKGMKQLHQLPNAKVVVFGGSYAGNLAAWYRELYPDSSIGAVASSAPVVAEVDFVEYLETVGNAQKYFVSGCYEAVSDAFDQIQQLVADKDDKQIQSLFGICDGRKLNYSDRYEVETFYGELYNSWMGTTQYNDVGNSSKLAGYCRTMVTESFGDALHRYSRWFKSTGQSCVNVDYKSEVQALKQESWSSFYVFEGIRQWFWQTCTEFAYYQSSDSKNQPFGYRTVDVDYLVDLYCTQAFGIQPSEVSANVDAANKKYGALKPNITNVFFFHGSVDPWHTLGIFPNDFSDSVPVRYIEGTSHCYDMYDARFSDPPQLTQARADMAAVLDTWLA